jgi:hypothetical protein
MRCNMLVSKTSDSKYNKDDVDDYNNIGDEGEW